MAMGLLFWILMLLWLVFGVWSNWPSRGSFAWGGSLLEFLLFLLLGWVTFGAPVR